MRVSMREPHPGDVRTLAEAEQSCFVDPWPGQLLATEILAPGRFHRLLVDPSGELVAYLLSAWQFLDLHVLKVATMPGYRRLGLAQRLIAVAEQHVVDQGGESLTLEVRESNHAAVALYTRLAFVLAGRRPAYYSDGEDALVMTKHMPG
jgi:ribosomal-protein-alanine N-acetyltransferase